MAADKNGFHISFVLLAIIANLGIAISTESTNAQTADEPVGGPPLRISPFPAERELEEADIDECLSSPYRCIDGIGNNLEEPLWGSAEIQLLRQVLPHYGDVPNKGTRLRTEFPNPRVISNLVADHGDDPIPNDKLASAWVWAWGQFIDHDMDLVFDSGKKANIPIPPGDPFFDPLGDGDKEFEFHRSETDPGSNPRQQINSITAYIDASNVYGSDYERAEALRDPQEPWRLRTSEGDLLPFNTAGLPNANGSRPPEQLFLAGDVRANEQVLLTAIHTLFVREHNRLAEEIAADDISLSDDQVYHEARRLVAATIQSITYNEFLPMLLGPNALEPYAGYNPNVNPGVSNVFATAAYRFGHSMVNPTLILDGGLDLSLRDAFFNPDAIIDSGIEPFLAGAAVTIAEEVDPLLVDDIRNFLFGPPGAGGFDLASLNIQRGRDHGIPGYNEVREEFGLAPMATLDDITSRFAARLESIYDDPYSCDFWVCAIAEDHVPGALVGETVKAILVDQFQRSRDGDRFWYERDLTKEKQRGLLTLKELLAAHGVKVAGNDPFHVTRGRGRS